MLTAGTKLGRYEIRSKIGEGGMGEVYLAQDTKLDRKVALKILPADVAAEADRMKRFVQEAKAASALNHPNIITIYEIDETDSGHFIATEFIEGMTLRERELKEPLQLAESLDISAQIAGALSAAHAAGIVHRDIKPENVMIRRDGIVKVLDFGLAKLAAPSLDSVDGEASTRANIKTDPGVVMGTAIYMSPEQARGLPVDARTDIFSLGVVLYEMVAGRLPFEGSNLNEIMASVLSDKEPQPLTRYSSEAPTELGRIVLKALRKNRDERYQTIKDMLLDLTSLKHELEFARKLERSAPPKSESATETTERPEPAAKTFAQTAEVQSQRVFSRRVLITIAALLILMVGVTLTYVLVSRRSAATASAPEIKSLAVLPLKSLNAGDDYLGLGIADAAIRKISQTGKVIVRPTSAVSKYTKQDIDALSVAKELGVDSVLEGSFQRAGERLRVSVNLWRTSDGQSLWSDQYDLQTTDIFSIEDTVAQQVASHLRLQLDASQQAQLTKRYTSSPIAYELYLKGVYGFDQRVSATRTSMEATIDLFKQAIQVDPNFALAHAQLAYAYATLSTFFEPNQPAWADRAREEIDRAQQLDPQLAETHLARFMLLFSAAEGYQSEAAIREVLLAQQLNPNVGHAELGYLFLHVGPVDAGERELQRASEIDPTSGFARDLAILKYAAGCRYDEYFTARSTLFSDNPPPIIESWYLMSKGRWDEAGKELDRMAGSSDAIQLLPKRALLTALRGDFRTAEASVPAILKLHPAKDPLYHHATYDIASIYALQGKTAEAVKWLRETAANGFHPYGLFECDANLNRIRQAPEFIQFMSEMKLLDEKYRREFGVTSTR